MREETRKAAAIIAALPEAERRKVLSGIRATGKIYEYLLSHGNMALNRHKSFPYNRAAVCSILSELGAEISEGGRGQRDLTMASLKKKH